MESIILKRFWLGFEQKTLKGKIDIVTLNSKCAC